MEVALPVRDTESDGHFRIEVLDGADGEPVAGREGEGVRSRGEGDSVIEVIRPSSSVTPVPSTVPAESVSVTSTSEAGVPAVASRTWVLSVFMACLPG